MTKHRWRLTLIVLLVLSSGGILRPTDDATPMKAQAPGSGVAADRAGSAIRDTRALSRDEARNYAAREDSAGDLATFEAGDEVVFIGGGTLLLLLIILIILL